MIKLSRACPCPRCHIQRRIAGLIGAALEAEGENAWTVAKRLGTSSIARAKKGENCTIGVLAMLFSALDYDLVIQIRKRQDPAPMHLPEIVQP